MSILKHSIRTALGLSVAVAAAQSASALDISLYNASTVNVYLSGSTAVDGTLLNTAIATASPGGLCASGTVDVYYIGTASSYTNRMIFCSSSSTVTSTAGTLPAGTQLAIFKESNVGSENGVSPLYLTAQGQPNTLRSSIRARSPTRSARPWPRWLQRPRSAPTPTTRAARRPRP